MPPVGFFLPPGEQLRWRRPRKKGSRWFQRKREECVCLELSGTVQLYRRSLVFFVRSRQEFSRLLFCRYVEPSLEILSSDAASN